MADISSQINSFYSSKSYKIENILIDIGDEWEGSNSPEYILLTHCHFDHIYGLNKAIAQNPKVRVYTNEYGKHMLMDARLNLSLYHDSPFVISDPNRIVVVNDGDEIELHNGIKAKAIFTPGHNPSCITWLIGNAIFTGDSYIPGVPVVTKLPKGNRSQAVVSVDMILSLARDRAIFPGHEI